MFLLVLTVLSVLALTGVACRAAGREVARADAQGAARRASARADGAETAAYLAARRRH